MRIIVLLIIVIASSRAFCKDLDFSYFTMTVEDNWQVEELLSGKHIKLRNSNGSVSTLKLRYVFVSRDVNIDELKSKNKSLDIKQIGDFQGADGSHKVSVEDGSYSKDWILYHKNMLLLVTHTSEREVSGLDHQMVQSVLGSLRWKQIENIAATN